MKKWILLISVISWLVGCKSVDSGNNGTGWSVSVIPPSVRLDPTSNEIIDHRFLLQESREAGNSNILKENLIYDGKRVSLHAARGEYISFQLVLTNNTGKTLKNIRIEMPEFAGNQLTVQHKTGVFS